MICCSNAHLLVIVHWEIKTLREQPVPLFPLKDEIGLVSSHKVHLNDTLCKMGLFSIFVLYCYTYFFKITY